MTLARKNKIEQLSNDFKNHETGEKPAN